MSISTRQEETRAEVEALEGLTYKELKSHYQELTDHLPPKRIGRTLLKLAVAYEIQRKDHKALVIRVHKKLARITEAKDVSDALKKPQRQIKPGGRLVREWRGKSYEVYVADDGVFMDGKQYKSLSAVASAITGAKWNGPRFFGLRSPRIEQGAGS